MTSTELPSTRADAKAQGQTRYFSGKPCARGHVAPRYASTGQCTACQLVNYRNATGYGERKSADAMRADALATITGRGGRWLSGEVTSAKSKIRVDCGAGHPAFTTDCDRLKQGKWCRLCWEESTRGDYGHTIEDMQRVAHERGGECLSSEFRGVKAKLEWRCPEHGPFIAAPDAVMNSGTWCPTCGQAKKGHDPRPLADVLAYIAERGGELASPVEEYSTLQSRITVRCSNGHEWEVGASQLIHAQSWCPNCRYTGEAITRHIFEATFGVAFPKVRPAFLRTDAGGTLELDGYSEPLRLAFEYQGPRHDEPEQAARDALKRERCEAVGIRLVAIPFLKRPYPPEAVRAVIAETLAPYDDREVRLPTGPMFPRDLERLRELAEARGGRLLSTDYGGENELHLWKCDVAEHPPWNAPPYNIKNGTWCAHCAGVAKKDRPWLAAWGSEHGLTLLTEEYLGSGVAHRWRCAAGHEFEAAKPNMLQAIGKGHVPCSRCAGNRRTIRVADLNELATARGGQCLSAAYEKAVAPLSWRCAHGHEFERSWYEVQQGRWCLTPGCADSRNWGRWA